VEEAASRNRNDDPRRRYYRLTRFGRSLLAAEVERLDTVIREARIHLRTHPRRST
jgi:DNA-binding PadR family transcriptional regulator